MGQQRIAEGSDRTKICLEERGTDSEVHVGWRSKEIEKWEWGSGEQG
jgi:hypothetical protein